MAALLADYELVVIGGGPAGLTAGIYAARSRLNFLLFEKVVPGGQILTTDWIENYPGFPEGLSGYDLAWKIADQLTRFDAPVENAEVLSMECSGPVKRLVLKDRTISTHTVIIATGASPNLLSVPGEDAYLGKGVSFCATCDGPFYKDKRVAVMGGGDTAVQEGIFLTKLAETVYIIHRREQLRATRILQERAFANPKIKFIWNSVVTQIEGNESGVEKLIMKNVKTGAISDLSVDAFFIFIGTRPNTGFLCSEIKTNEEGFVIADQNMETSVPGVYAVGDVRNTPLRQVVTAVGDAAIAAVCAEKYVENLGLAQE
ncbi:MAG: thioredoxin-disulfide reductase [Desulfobacterales bacterium C00003104]|jgi:thioredoxin reductase (NADPH)|nr:MAG: thioredoxin-disulfide reductase [Desulfobacterales bacterium C00003104]